MKSKSYTRYYNTHREEILQKMRDRDASRRAELKEKAAADPIVAEELREKYKAKYHNRIANTVLKQVNEWLADEKVLESFKSFLRANVLANDAYKTISLRSLKTLADLNIMREATPLQLLTQHRDGPTKTDE